LSHTLCTAKYGKSPTHKCKHRVTNRNGIIKGEKYNEEGKTYMLACHALADDFSVLVDKDIRLCSLFIDVTLGNCKERLDLGFDTDKF
jgi:hypothetical protein